MITSSNFFDKSFFTLEEVQGRLNNDEVSPWNLSIQNDTQNKSDMKNKNKNGVHELSRISSKKYIQKKLRANSILNNRSHLPPLKERYAFYTIEQSNQANKKLKQYKSTSVDQQLVKKRSNIFPQLSIFQYKQLYEKKKEKSQAQGTSEEILMKKKGRRKPFEQSINGRSSLNQKQKQRKKTMYIPPKQIINSKYVCAVKKPNLNVVGVPTNKFVDLL